MASACVTYAGVVVKIIGGSLAVGCAAGALIVQARALGRANAFMSKYGEAVPALRPLVRVQLSGGEGFMQRVLCATPMDPLL
jgi:hypothetical protein